MMDTGGETAITITGSGSLMFDGEDSYAFDISGYSSEESAIVSDVSFGFENLTSFTIRWQALENTDSSNVDMDTINGGAIDAAGAFTLSNIDDVELFGNSVNNFYDQNVGSVSSSGGVIYAGDIVFDELGSLTLSNNSVSLGIDASFLDDDAMLSVSTYGGALASSNGIAISDVDGISMTMNYVSSMADRMEETDGLIVPDTAAWSKGGVMFAADGDIVISNVGDVFEIAQNSVMSNTNVQFDDSLGEVHGAGSASMVSMAYGGALYAEGNIRLENTSLIDANSNGASARLDVYNVDSHNFVVQAQGGMAYAKEDIILDGNDGLQFAYNGAYYASNIVNTLLEAGSTLDTWGMVSAGGGVLYAGGDVFIRNSTDDLVFTDNSITGTAYYNATNQFLPVGDTSVDFSINQSATGGAIHSDGNIGIASIEGGLRFENNYIALDHGYEVIIDAESDVNLEAHHFVAGGVLYAGESLSITGVQGDMLFEKNTLTSNAVGIAGIAETVDPTAPSAQIDLTMQVYGGVAYAANTLQIEGIGGDVIVTENEIHASPFVSGFVTADSSLMSRLEVMGGGLAAGNSLVIKGISGDLNITANTVAGMNEGSACYTPGVDLGVYNFIYGAGAGSGNSLLISDIGGEAAFGCNYIMNSVAVDDCSLVNSEAVAVSAGAGLYAADTMQFSKITGQLIIGQNAMETVSTFVAQGYGAGAHADRIVIDQAKGGVLVELNRNETSAAFFAGTMTDREMVSHALGGGLSGGSLVAFSNFEQGMKFLENYAWSYASGEAQIDAKAMGGAVYSGDKVVFSGGNGPVLFEHNFAFANVCAEEARIEALAGGGAIAALGGMGSGDPINGNVTFRGNYALISASDCGSGGLTDIHAVAAGGALYLGGTGAFQNVNGTMLFENNYALGASCNDEKVEARGGAVALAEGANALFNANMGDIVFRDNATGTTNTCGLSLDSYGGAIYVTGGSSVSAADALVLGAEEGYIVAFTGNKTHAVFSDSASGDPIEIIGPYYNSNAIHMNRNAQVHFTGSGAIFFDANPISSGGEGGVSLLRTGSGTTYFYNCESIINGAGKGDQAARIEGGSLHTSDGAALRVKGGDALFTVARGGTLTGGGVYGSEGGFLIEGTLAPDSIVHTLDQGLARAATHPAIASTGDSYGRMTLDGNARFNGGALAHEIDMVRAVSDVVVVTGTTTGNGWWAPINTHVGDVTYEDVDKRVVIMESYGDPTPGAVIGGTMDIGNYKIHIESGANPNGPGSAWWTAISREQSSQVDVVLNTVGSMSGIAFRQLDNLVKRMGDLRLSPERPKCGGDTWVRTYGHQSTIDLKIPGINDFREYQYGADLGYDCLYTLNERHKLAVGFFAGYQRLDRQFHDEHRSRGNTDSVAGGIYLTWLEKKGWYADLVIKGQSFDNTGKIHGTQPSKFQYDTWGMGVSLEAGRNFQLKNSWFVEPMAQVAWFHVDDSRFALSNGTAVSAKSSDAWQITGVVRGGRNNHLGKDGQHTLQTYAKAGVLQQVSGHGRVHMGDQSWRPNTDGTMGLVGVGAIWQHKRHQMHLDFEAAIGSKVDIPWNVNLGYRITF